MILQSLIGQTFLEAELFELLLSDIEGWPNHYDNVHCHLYLERLRVGVVRVSEIRNFADGDQLIKCSKSIIEKREWIEINHTKWKVLVHLVRLDRSGYVALMRKRGTYIADWEMGWADEWPEMPPMTDEEWRQGFQELCGLLEDEVEMQKLKSKKTV